MLLVWVAPSSASCSHLSKTCLGFHAFHCTKMTIGPERCRFVETQRLMIFDPPIFLLSRSCSLGLNLHCQDMEGILPSAVNAPAHSSDLETSVQSTVYLSERPLIRGRQPEDAKISSKTLAQNGCCFPFFSGQGSGRGGPCGWRRFPVAMK